MDNQNNQVREENEPKKNNSSKVILLVLGIVTVIVALVGATFAYFTALISKPNGDQSVLLTTTTVQGLVYTSSDIIKLENVTPGATNSAKFSIQNPNSVASVVYSLNFVPVINTFTKDAVNEEESTTDDSQLTLTITGGQIAGQVVLDYTDGSMEKKPIVTDVTIEHGAEDEYTAKLDFIETNANQNSNQGKSFAGYVELIQSNITTQNN